MGKKTSLTMGMVWADIRAAEMALDEFDRNKIKDIKSVSAYHIQQAFEKMMKLQMYNVGSNLDNRVMYGHSIGNLIGYSKKTKLPIYYPKYLEENAEIITDWEAGSRYDHKFSVRVTSLKRAIKEEKICMMW